MEYFVSIENKTYFLWQIELLIESFKQHNQEDNLIIGIAENDNPVANKYTKNILNHKRKFIHPNYGKKYNFPQSNKIYSLISALDNEFITQPFTLIHPDMVLQHPINEIKSNLMFGATINEKDLQNKIESDIKQIISKRLIGDNVDWFTMGDVITFNGVPKTMFYRILEHMQILSTKFGKDWNIIKAAIMLTFFEICGNVSHEVNNDLEIGLIQENEKANFIHYKYGIPPAFSKLHYKYENEFGYFAVGDGPYATLLEHNPNITTNYLQSIINSLNEV